ncbi:putative mitochondrial hypothetical protein [Leptomonas pyrrhocoris]|uniref:Uncharacterized protein n=1 Tax=Leptomonas pyrrhocoris TaxID=157538 RepID=A0A0N0VEQ3_LEPPY|nr:putative mitochondrial hypothetical protein [Leptomonas pyrrhocoris]KPA78608.1 putative mitochondrial hypothetical protein [Leptomonas pyrrhocoris]|eukprot:XP_015657047.1 putative mitochondrial hypothetical protein [Leptomonas pyrrhocoris]
MRASALLRPPASKRALQRVSAGREGRQRGVCCVVRRPTLLQYGRRYSTRDRPTEQLHQPRSSTFSPRPRPPRTSHGATSTSSLNLLSQKVRQHLAAYPLLPTAPVAGDAELWVIDELLQLLLSLPPVQADSASTATAASSTAASRLHPLLCVRVLQRLGYAVCENHRRGNTSDNGTMLMEKGWTTRHVYPSFTFSSAATDPSAPPPLSSSLFRHAPALAGITATVLGPLLLLLGDGTPPHPPHTQVAPVVPIVVEWLCTLPTAETTLPVVQWLPWVAAQYREAVHQGEDSSGVEAVSETNKLKNDGVVEAQRPTAPPPLLPPLEQLLPHLIRKLAQHLSRHEDFCAAPGDGAVFFSDVCERELSTLFRLCGHASPSVAPWTSEVTEVGAPPVTATLSDVLWWSGDEPLVRLAGVRRALAHAVLKDVDASADACHPQPSLVEEGSVDDSAGARERGGPEQAQTWTTLETNSGISLMRVPANALHPVSPTDVRPVLSLRLSDDDAYRRFLLRLTALQHTLLEEQQQEQQQRQHTDAPDTRGAAVVFLSLELSDALSDGGLNSAAKRDSHDDPDVVLRFIQPLHEYVLLLRDGLPDGSSPSPSPSPLLAAVAAAPVRLTFSAVIRVLTAAFRRLEELKQESSCRYAAAPNAALRSTHAQSTSPPSAAGVATTAYTLLPQKARLHALKRLCEVLLHHVRDVLAAREAAATASDVNASASSSPSFPAFMCAPPWFVEVDVRQQEAVLRRLCGAARALVRVVMEERRISLLEEGPEGSVLSASSITAAHRNRLASTTAAESSEEVKPATAGSEAAAVAASTAGVMKAPEKWTAAGVASFDHTLRTLAFRVVEPAVWRLYDACAQHQVSLPLHVLTFEEWLSYLNIALGEDTDGGGGGGHTTHSGAPIPQHRGGDVPMELHSYIPVMAAARALYESVGERSGLQTAQQILPRPGQQSISALVEGIRLTALQCCFFDGLRGSAASSLPEQLDYVEAHTRWVLAHTSAAFFSVWQRTSQTVPTLRANDVDAAASNGVREAPETVEDGQQRLRHRLGLLTLALHLHVLRVRQRLSFTSAAGLSKATSTLRGAADSAATVFPSSLTSLLHCLIREPAGAAASTSTSARSLLPDGHQLEMDSIDRDEWSLVLRNDGIRQACRLPPPGMPSGCASLWELTEELLWIAGHVGEGEASRRKERGATWRWLGSPEALWGVVEEPAAAVVGAADSITSPVASLPSRFFLLPWTTLARSHQLLRVYDESGQSERAAREWEAALQVWLTGGGDDAAMEASNSIGWRPAKPVVRLVSMAEELRFFSSLQQEPMVQLAPDVRVVCEGVRREVEALVPTVRRELQSSKERRERLADAESLGAEKGWYTEDDYDGLD